MVIVDRFTKYSHFLALSHPYTDEKVAEVFMEHVYKLHGLPNDIVSDRDKVFVSKFWKKLFSQLHVSLSMSSAYHPQSDGQTERVNKCLETYLRCMANKHRSEKSFTVGDLVYLKIQPYKQVFLAVRFSVMLTARIYGPFRVMERIGEVAYRLELPVGAAIHPVFHVSQLKKKVGEGMIPQPTLPLTDPEEMVLAQPLASLGKRLIKKNNQAEVEILVQWANLPKEAATWENYHHITKQFPEFDPWGQGSLEGEGNVTNKEGKREKEAQEGELDTGRATETDHFGKVEGLRRRRLKVGG
ncbi:PREDICTED: uncharacterized protein LOC109159923 [Ipomoea nil]|uniref:uncharacterized protein LOC109159923 n=1 Tax=Ipomoea nil TaxID=35883 RepID=UPI0009013087|nr:PREDICTED: uncharacterized protein LOC109159923 [Ipomoea nil]